MKQRPVVAIGPEILSVEPEGRPLKEDLQAARRGLAERDGVIAALKQSLQEQTDRALRLQAEADRREDYIRTLRGEPLSAPSPSGPRIRRLHPERAFLGEGFNVQGDGLSHLAVSGEGFGADAVIVMAGQALDTVRCGEGLLSAVVPAALIDKPGPLPVWVDDRGEGGVSSMGCFLVFDEKDRAVFEPAQTPGTASDLLYAIMRRFYFAATWRAKLPFFYVAILTLRARRLVAFWRARLRLLPAAALKASAVLNSPPRGVPRKPDILCFSIIDWDFRYQRPQQLLSRFAADGHRVFYLSQRFFSGPGESFKLRELGPGLYELFLRSTSPLNIYQDSITGGFEDALYQALLDFKSAAGLDETICVVQLPFWTPLALRLRRELGFRVVFDCLDDFSGFKNTGPAMLAWEQTLASKADLVLASSQKLFAKQAAYNGRCVLVPNAADYAHFSHAVAPAEELSLEGPVFGYYGAISHWFDADLVAHAAEKRPQWSFVLIGHTDGEVRRRLKSLRNVRFLPEKPYAELPRYLTRFDVCLIPFKLDGLIEATSPVKFYEFLAAGKPVVAAAMPELAAHDDVSYLYQDREDFLQQAERALSQAAEPGLVEKRRSRARENTWNQRCAVIETAAAALYPKASVIVVTYNNLDLTKACVESLLAKTAYPGWEAVIVDNASSDGTREYLLDLQRKQPRLRVILNDANRGFAAANNQGIRASSGERIVLLNNDTVVTHGWLGQLLKHLEDPRTGLVGPVTNNIGNEARIPVTYSDLSGLDAFAERQGRAHAGQTFDIRVLAMFCVAMRRSLFDGVGLLDERYEVGMFEDDDFSRAVQKKGYRTLCAEDVFIHHVGGASFKKLPSSDYRRIFEANKARFEAKWGEPWTPHRYRNSSTPLRPTEAA